ncbi:MAG: hypothetical protein NC483_01480 [Ruminococcus sp.]|nr:hypothetical protein [Ruminococcus sp.]
MTKILNNKSLLLLIFLGIFGFSIGLFDNYRDLWMNSNGISTISISKIISVSYLVTVLVLLYFTIRVPSNKLKDGILVSLVLVMVTGTVLVCLNNTSYAFLIKFLMFFNIAFNQVVLSSIYPLIMNISKNDLVYTKKDVVESLASKLGFLIVSILIGKKIGSIIIDYNICLLLSIVFTFLAFVILINIDIKFKNNNRVDVSKTLKYFNNNKVLYFYLITNLMGSIVYSIILGMPMMRLTTGMGFLPNKASFIVLGCGILANVLALIVVKYLNFKNDHINIFFKYGIRIVLYLLVFLTGNRTLYLVLFIWLLLSDTSYGFIFSAYFINNINDNYTMFLVVLKYISALIGNAVGVFICGLVFNMNISYLVMPALILGIIHYIMASILVNKKKIKLKNS